jgi:hypothetical protein
MGDVARLFTAQVEMAYSKHPQGRVSDNAMEHARTISLSTCAQSPRRLEDRLSDRLRSMSSTENNVSAREGPLSIVQERQKPTGVHTNHIPLEDVQDDEPAERAVQQARVARRTCY